MWLCFTLQRIQAALFGHEDKKVRLALPGMSSFISTDKPNFKITTVRDRSPSPFTAGMTWSLLNTPLPSSSHSPGPSSQLSTHEKRASVIMKTSDASKSSVKTCWWNLHATSSHQNTIIAFDKGPTSSQDSDGPPYVRMTQCSQTGRDTWAYIQGVLERSDVYP